MENCVLCAGICDDAWIFGAVVIIIVHASFMSFILLHKSLRSATKMGCELELNYCA